MATGKAVLKNASISAYGSDTRGTLTYFIEGVNAADPFTAMEAAKNAVGRRIGDVVSPKIKTNLAGIAQEHTLRVFGLRPYTTDNGTKFWVDIEYRSQPVFAFTHSSTLLQRRTATFLDKGSTPDDQKRKQITVTYKDAITKVSQREMPGSANQYYFNDTFTLTNTFYADEIAKLPGGNLDYLFRYANVVNSSPMKFSNVSQAPGVQPSNNFGSKLYPARAMLCNGITSETHDGGQSYSVSASLIYNPESWDAIVTYTYNGEPAVLSAATLAEVTKFLSSMAVANQYSIPDPVNTADAGAGRFPLYHGYDFYPLVNCLMYKIFN